MDAAPSPIEKDNFKGDFLNVLIFLHPQIPDVQNIVKYCPILTNHTSIPYVTLDHKTSLMLHGYICGNSQQNIVWVKIIDFSFMPKIIRILSKDHVP